MTAVDARRESAIEDAETNDVLASFASITPAARRRAFAILFGSQICLGARQSVMFAVLPSMARELGLTEFEASLPFVISATIWVFSSHYWGKLSDRRGRRPVILLGLLAFAASFALFATFVGLGVSHVMSAAVAYPAMIAARALFGIFGSGATPAAQAYVADRTTRAERTRGVAGISAASGLGSTVGPGVGSALVVFGLLAPFYFTAAVAVVSALAIWFFLPEPTRPQQRADRKSRLKWHDARILPFVLLGVGAATAAAIPIQTLGYLVIDVLHFSPERAPQYTGIGLLALALATLFAQLVIVQRFQLSARTLIRWGMAVAALSFLLFAISRQFGPLVFALLLAGLGFGMVRPGCAAAASLAVDADEQGTVAGVIGGTSAGGFIFGPMIATSLYRVSPAAPYIFGAAIMLALFAYAMLARALQSAGAVAPESDFIEETPDVPNA